MSDDVDGRGFDYFAPDVVAARAAVGRAISDYVAAIRPDETPYVTAWAVGLEWTNTELEQAAQAGRDLISPSEQTISAPSGLGHYLAHRFD